MPAEVIKLVHAMISLTHQGLHLLRRMFDRCSGREKLNPPSCELDADAASAMIEDLLRSGRPRHGGAVWLHGNVLPHNYWKLGRRAGIRWTTSQAGGTSGGGIKAS